MLDLTGPGCCLRGCLTSAPRRRRAPPLPFGHGEGHSEIGGIRTPSYGWWRGRWWGLPLRDAYYFVIPVSLRCLPSPPWFLCPFPLSFLLCGDICDSIMPISLFSCELVMACSVPLKFLVMQCFLWQSRDSFFFAQFLHLNGYQFKFWATEVLCYTILCFYYDVMALVVIFFFFVAYMLWIIVHL